MSYFGYVRVSSSDQKIDRQMVALKEIGLDKKRIYIDKQSGKNFDRPAYKKLIKRLKAGDALYIKSIDRLGRNYKEILEHWNYITKVKNVDIVVIDFPLLDTRNNQNGLTGQFIADLVLQILSYVAEIERENIHQRQAEGIKSAKSKGIKFGRPRKEIPKDFFYYMDLWKEGKISKREASKRLNINHRTFSNWLDLYCMKENCEKS